MTSTCANTHTKLTFRGLHMNKQTYLAIENAVSNIQDNGSLYKSRLASMIIDELSDKKHPAANIIDAIWQATMRNAKFNQDETVRCKAIGALYKPEIYDIAFYGFIQNIMDRVCWNARAGLNARLKNDADEELSAGGTGVDFSDLVSDEISFDLSTPSGIAEQVNEIYTKLMCVSADIAVARKIDAEPLHMFSPSDLVNGEWVQTHKIDDWDEAVSVMNDIVVAINQPPELSEEDIFAPRKYA